MRVEEAIRKIALLVLYFSLFGVLFFVFLIVQSASNTYYSGLSNMMFYFRSPRHFMGKGKTELHWLLRALCHKLTTNLPSYIVKGKKDPLDICSIYGYYLN